MTPVVPAAAASAPASEPKNCECQIANPEKTCETKIMNQVTHPTELFNLMIGANGAEHTFKVVLKDETTKKLFERHVTLKCHGFHLAIDDKTGKPLVEVIKTVPMTKLVPNQPEPQFIRQSIQLKSLVKKGNAMFFGGKINAEREPDGGKPVFSLDGNLNVVIKKELATAEELAQAKPILDFFEAMPRT
jgi:hypothetical protein